MDTTKKTFKAMDITDYRNADDNEFEEEVYEYQDDGCEGSYMNFIFCPTLQELLQKYDYDIKSIDYEPMDKLDEEPTHFKHYAIEFRNAEQVGFEIDEIMVINYSHPYEPTKDSKGWCGHIRNFPIVQLLGLRVNLHSWVKNNSTQKEEKEIVEKIYKILTYKPKTRRKLKSDEIEYVIKAFTF
jgi:hypothetical protein